MVLVGGGCFSLSVTPPTLTAEVVATNTVARATIDEAVAVRVASTGGAASLATMGA